MPASTARSSVTRLFVLCLAVELACGYAHARATAPRSGAISGYAAIQDKDKKQDIDKDKDKKEDEKKDQKEDKEAQKIEVRNNAASLLADLLGDEKNVSKLLIIKHGSPETEQLIKTISKTADDGAKQLEALTKIDNALKLDAMQLPPGEKATREAESKTEEHALLFSSGAKFELNLLLTQAQALGYGSHLAKVAADNSSAPEAQREFHALETSLNDLHERVVARMRVGPQTKT
jgi:hypothetical protein